MRSKLEGLVELAKTEAGILRVAWLKRLRANRIAQVAATHHIETIPLDRFAPKTPRPEALVLGFASYDSNQIRDAVDQLARAFAACTEEPESVATAR